MVHNIQAGNIVDHTQFSLPEYNRINSSYAGLCVEYGCAYRKEEEREGRHIWTERRGLAYLPRNCKLICYLW